MILIINYNCIWIIEQYTMDCYVWMADTSTEYTLYSVVQFRVTLVPMVYSVTGIVIFDLWSLRADVISGMDHMRSDSSCHFWGTVCGNIEARCTTNPSEQCQPCWEWVKVSDRPYEESYDWSIYLRIKFLVNMF
jgi:hypothetical protein